MTAQPGSAGTAGRNYRAPKAEPKHRAPPTVPTPRAPTVIAVAAAVLTAASLVAIAGAAVAPDARAAGVHGLSVSTVTRAERTDAGPLVLPTVGVSGAWQPSEVTRTAVRPVTVHRAAVRTQRPASTRQAVLMPIQPPQSAAQPTVTPAPQPVTTETAAAPPTTTAAATSSATTTEEPAVTTPTESTVTVDVAAEVAG